jgi:glyoxylase-like metal-dependent hydrolase (beta-lactamase superfamily II)
VDTNRTVTPPTHLPRALSRRTLLRRTGAAGMATAAVAAIGVRPILAGARQASPVPGEAGSYRFAIGAVTATLVSDGTAAFPNPTGILFTNAPADALAAELREHGAPDPWPEWITPFTPLLIETGRQRVLIDTGFGGSVAPTAGRLPETLRAVGVPPEEIDLVVLSHGHPDHIGGATDGAGTPAFPNARYAMSRADWEFWTDEARVTAHVAPGDFRDLMLAFAATHLPPLRDRIDLLADGDEIVPGLRVIAAPGHTPGHLVIDVASGGERLLYGADTVLHPIHLEHPDWLTVFDTHPEPTTGTRGRILDLAAREDALMTAYHVPFPGLGRVVAEGEAWRWEAVTSLP